MPDRRSVALIIETSNAYARGLLDGIIAYQREHELWSIYVAEQERGAQPPDWLKSWRGDGIIARIETAPIASAVRRTKLPAVDVSAARLVPEIPWVETNDTMIAQLAARHLVDRGFKTLAYCGEPQFNWSKWREESFIAFAQEAGCQHFVFEGKSQHDKDYSWNRERTRLKAWVESLPKPLGVMACYDFKGQQLLDVCRELGVAVPEQVAVIGVDNDARLCRLCTPPLSSVIPDTHRTGYEAAQLLDSLMRGKPVPTEATLIPPIGIAERQSTDAYALDDPDIVTAMRFIREHACDGITVADVLRVVPLSRRKLEQRFLKLVRRTPYAEISRIRMERAGRLLRETSLPLAEIARRAGFTDPLYLSRAFKKHVGVSPRAYRKDAHIA
ncbi:MAG: DNA-binding transcriptional regulator [Pirellulales bacterium]|nr:DNA-binding transcriptional regulator [Pirellulales bacterium]